MNQIVYPNPYVIAQPTGQNILWTGGIGDVLVIDSFYPQEFKDNIKHMLWATPAAKEAIEIYKAIYPNVQHTILYDDWNRRPWFGSAGEVWQVIGKKIHDVKDMSIICQYPLVPRGALTYHGCSIFLKELTNIQKFNLPSQFIFTHSTPANREQDPKRCLTEADWAKLKTISDSRQMPVLLFGTDQNPAPEWVVDMRNKTTIVEAFEILKHASMFVGIASCFAVMAPKFMDNENMLIKCNETVMYNKLWFFAPKTTYEYLSLGAL